MGFKDLFNANHHKSLFDESGAHVLFLWLFLGESKDIPRPDGTCNPPSMLWLCLGVQPLLRSLLENLLMESVCKQILNQMH